MRVYVSVSLACSLSGVVSGYASLLLADPWSSVCGRQQTAAARCSTAVLPHVNRVCNRGSGRLIAFRLCHTCVLSLGCLAVQLACDSFFLPMSCPPAFRCRSVDGPADGPPGGHPRMFQPGPTPPEGCVEPWVTLTGQLGYGNVSDVVQISRRYLIL